MFNAIFAKSFDDISIIPTFVLTPLTYLGGVFFSISLLPPFWQKVALANPILYMVNAFRYGMLGSSDIPIGSAYAMMIVFAVALFAARARDVASRQRGQGLEVCGRFALFASPELVAEYFALAEPPSLAPHYNLTPGQDIAAVRVDRDGARRLHALRWGLVPFWAKDAAIGRRLINARLDSLADKPAFREALARRRCLIPASGFYEWGSRAAGKKQPLLRSAARRAAARDRWPVGALARAERRTAETCVIVTTDANETLASIHDRMPVMLTRAAQERRGSIAEATVATIAELAARGPELEAWPVGTAVNDPRNDDERVIAPKTASL